MREHSRNERQRFSLILATILVIHAIILLFTYQMSVPEYFSKAGTKKKISVIQVRKIERVLRNDLKQIVESDDPEEFKESKDSRYLSDKNRHFDRETVSRHIGTFKKQKRTQLSLSDLGQQTHPLMAAAKAYAARGNKHQETEGDVSATSDYIEGVALGDLTYLNTQEYKYYGFYHRIKLKLEQFWGRGIHETAEKLYKSGRRIASDEKVITSLRVTLDEQGEIIAIAVVGPSGVSELDDTAIQAFNQAGPFPNPPKGMINGGKVILEWGFVVQT